MNERIRELADQVLPNEKEFHQGDPKDWGYFFSGDELEKFAELVVKAEPVQEPITRLEPVAWRFEARHIDTAFGPAVSLKHPGPEHKYMRNVEPLYTAPPQRKQAEPVQEPITRLFGTLPVHDAQQAEPVEPVAQYSDIVSDGGMDPRNKYDTAPPQRKLVPLTEEEINRIDVCIDESTPLKEGKSLFARAIENASWEKNRGQA